MHTHANAVKYIAYMQHMEHGIASVRECYIEYQKISDSLETENLTIVKRHALFPVCECTIISRQACIKFKGGIGPAHMATWDGHIYERECYHVSTRGGPWDIQ